MTGPNTCQNISKEINEALNIFFNDSSSSDFEKKVITSLGRTYFVALGEYKKNRIFEITSGISQKRILCKECQPKTYTAPS